MKTEVERPERRLEHMVGADAADLLARIEPYRAQPGGTTKADRAMPCALCGWGPNTAIHTNPQLHGKGPYHAWRSNAVDKPPSTQRTKLE